MLHATVKLDHHHYCFNVVQFSYVTFELKLNVRVSSDTCVDKNVNVCY